MAIFDPIWAQAGTTVAFTEDEVRAGFSCGPVNPEQFNWLIQQLHVRMNTLDATDFVSDERVLATSAPLGGGGDLSTDRTLVFDIDLLTASTAVENSDLVIIYDTSAGEHRKVTYANFTATLGGDGVGLTAGANVGTGEGDVFLETVGSTFRLRSIKAGSNGISVATSGNEITIGIAAASETVVGTVELATPTEAIAGISTTLGVHPAGLQAAIDSALEALPIYFHH